MPTAHSLLKSKLVVTGIEIITITLQYAMFKNLGNYRAYIEMPLKSSTVIVLLLALTLLLMIGTVYDIPKQLLLYFTRT